ncbi:MAG: hypothetical protein H7Y15_06550 [Pseudonocardia sp.]|nr:hypothetical protein [Pseudonocardia sp.]
MIQVAGLLLAALGLVTQIVSGVPGFPPVPPGPIILVVAAAFVTFAPWRWAPIVGLAATVFLVVGLLVSLPTSGAAEQLADPGTFGPFAGTVLLMVGLLVALVAGAVATMTGFRRR